LQRSLSKRGPARDMGCTDPDYPRNRASRCPFYPARVRTSNPKGSAFRSRPKRVQTRGESNEPAGPGVDSSLRQNRGPTEKVRCDARLPDRRSRAHNPKVAGSNPAPATSESRSPTVRVDGAALAFLGRTVAHPLPTTCPDLAGVGWKQVDGSGAIGSEYGELRVEVRDSVSDAQRPVRVQIPFPAQYLADRSTPSHTPGNTESGSIFAVLNEPLGA